MLNYFPEDLQNERGVRRILTLDWISRRDKKWPLVPLDNLSPYTIDNQFRGPSDLYASKSNRPITLNPTAQIIEQLLSSFPILHKMFTKYPNKIAICGGILCRAALRKERKGRGESLRRHDCDIFFYGCPNPSSPEAQQEYRSILESCVAMIASKGKAVVDRTDNVINVVDHRDPGDVVQYQFILRIYPRLDMILGGFDIGPSMIGFDGEKVYTTQLGAWCYAKGALIVDTTRRSTSYERRLMKYHCLGFHIVFPGLDPNFSEAGEEISEEKIQEALMSVGYRLVGGMVCSHIVRARGDYTTTLNRHFGLKRGRVGGEIVLKTLKPRLTKKEKLFPHNMSRYTDYMAYKPSLCFYKEGFEEEKINVYISMMKNNQRERLFVCAALPKGKRKAKKCFAEMIDNPQIEVSQNDLEKNLEKLRYYNNYYGMNSRKEAKRFAEFYPEYQEFIRKDSLHSKEFKQWFSYVSAVLKKRVTERCTEWKEDFKGLKWRTQNPGTQHTSSINPIMEDPRCFYMNCYKSFKIGIDPEVEHCIWVLLRGGLKFPVELVRMIIRQVVIETHAYFTYTTQQTTKKRKRK